MTKEPVKELKKYHSRMTTILNELEILEDYVDSDYSDVLVDFRRVVHVLEDRRESLQRRGRRLWVI